MQLQTVILLLLSFNCCPVNMQDICPVNCSKIRYQTHNGSLLINSSISSEVINETNVASVSHCLMRCRMRGCLVAVFKETVGICQLVMVNDESQLMGPSVSHVHRVLGSEAGEKVSKVEDFEKIILMRRSGLTDVRFSHTSSGRNGFIQHAVISATGWYRIEVAGARGGNNSYQNTTAGRGALVAGIFNLTAGTQLTIVVGQMGGQGNGYKIGGGGGGGSFVYTSGDNQLLMAAGGGGGASYVSNGSSGECGANGGNSTGFSDYYSGIGGINGQPGFSDPSKTPSDYNHGGCGAGWLGKAVNPRRHSKCGDRGGGQADSWVGGLAGVDSSGHGGFGGGGGGGGGSYGGAGAGGGFSGGGAGLGASHSGGGGGSFCSGSGCTAATGGNTGSDHGFVVLKLLVTMA